MIRKFLPRRANGVILTMALVAGVTVSVGSSAYAAADPLPANGRPCTLSEIGRQIFKVDSAVVSPVVTHFTSFYVTRGTLSENTYNLNVVNYVNTSINNHADASASLFGLVSRTVGFSVQTDNATTNTEETSVKWSFNEPGYYGLYKGTRRVTGTFSRAVCKIGLGFPRYSYQGGGTYSTFGYVEEGTIACGDKLPLGTVRRAAQAMLGCSTLSRAAKTTKTTGNAPAKGNPRNRG